jgi:hypothetical protein
MKRPSKHYATKLLIKALVAHMHLLRDEINDLCSLAITHGWQSRRVKAGEKTRARIKELCQIVYGKDMKWVQ